MGARQAPDFTLAHVTGRPVSLADYRGRPVVVIFGGRDSREQAQGLGRAIRARHGPEALPIVLVLDLREAPRPLRGLARGVLRAAFAQAAREAAAGLRAAGQAAPADLSRLVVMLPDWDGAVTASFGLSGVDRRAVAVLIDSDGIIRGEGAGPQGAEEILALAREHLPGLGAE